MINPTGKILLLACLAVWQSGALASEDPLADFYGADSKTNTRKPHTPLKARAGAVLSHIKHKPPKASKQTIAFRKAQAKMALGSTDMSRTAMWAPQGPLAKPVAAQKKSGTSPKRKWWHVL